ncbi:MAG TPA: hypothetical protein VGF01_00395 [Terracidiphilus sp.]
MKPRLVVLLLCASLLPAVQAFAKTILPDACGDDSVKFEVKTENDQPAPEPPPAGKAQIVFIENSIKDGTPTVRYGMDGAWVGANKGNSYFYVTVDPGVHHLCAGWQSSQGRLQKSIDVASFTAEPGKVYYFAASITMTGGGGGFIPPTMGPNGLSGGGPVMGGGILSFGLSQLNEDAGKYRVKAWKLAFWKTNK